jgi:hypothetical protein
MDGKEDGQQQQAQEKEKDTEQEAAVPAVVRAASSSGNSGSSSGSSPPTLLFLPCDTPAYREAMFVLHPRLPGHAVNAAFLGLLIMGPQHCLLRSGATSGVGVGVGTLAAASAAAGR